MATVNLGIPAVGNASFDEAKRQLDICNSCRYCAGYCPVWPALERRIELTPPDITHLANLCHDCRDCYLACMYTPPHEFGVNPPQVFAEERAATYQHFIWPAARLQSMSGAMASIGAAVVLAVILAVLRLLVTGPDAFAPSNGSVYSVIQHDVLLVLVGAPAVYSVIVLAAAALRYWRFAGGPFVSLFSARAWLTTLGQAATLHHSAGADEGCTYPQDRPTQNRRILHQFVMYGFLLTVVSTLSAGVEQYFIDILPPYPPLSVPVLSGVLGGVLQIAGCVGLILLKRRSDPGQTSDVMWRADFSFLWALLVLNASGLLVLFLRDSPVFAEALVLHLGAVMVAFAVAPYTKFVHFIFRVLAIYKNALETRAEQAS